MTTHNPLPGLSSLVSEDSQNDKLQSDPSRDGHAIENEIEPIPPRSEKPPLTSCPNVQTNGIEEAEISPVSVVLELDLRNTTGQHRLNSPAIFCIERAYGSQVIVNSMDKIDD